MGSKKVLSASLLIKKARNMTDLRKELVTLGPKCRTNGQSLCNVHNTKFVSVISSIWVKNEASKEADVVKWVNAQNKTEIANN